MKNNQKFFMDNGSIERLLITEAWETATDNEKIDFLFSRINLMGSVITHLNDNINHLVGIIEKMQNTEKNMMSSIKNIDSRLSSRITEIDKLRIINKEKYLDFEWNENTYEDLFLLDCMEEDE